MLGVQTVLRSLGHCRHHALTGRAQSYPQRRSIRIESGQQEELQKEAKDLADLEKAQKDFELEEETDEDPNAKPSMSFPAFEGEIQNENVKDWKKQKDAEIKEKAKGIQSFTGTFRDEMSTEKCTVFMRGDKVCLKILDAWEFVGVEWASLSSTQKVTQLMLQQEQPIFNVTEDDKFLTQFSLEWQMPIELLEHGKVITYQMEVKVQIDHRSEFQTEPQLYMVTLLLPRLPVKSDICKGIHGCLSDIRSRLPKHMKFHTCWNCQFSMYSPWGESSFGGLGCLINKFDNKSKREVPQGIFEMWMSKDRDVQENRVCGRWEERTSPQYMPDEKSFKRSTFSYRPNYHEEEHS